MPINLAIINDYPIVIAGLRAALAPHAQRVRVAEVALGHPLITEADVVLYDTFGTPYGPDADPRATLGIAEHTKLVAFTWDLEPRGVHAALARGFDGFVSKTVSAEELVSALEWAHRGERVVPDLLPLADGEGLLGRWPGEEHGLSPRESQVLALICQGLSNAEIAAAAYLGINTVKTYIRSAYRKMEVTTRAQAVIWGLSHGFAPQPQRR